MDVATTHVQHAAGVDVGIDDLANAALVEQFQLGVAIALPELFLGFQVLHVLAIQGGKHTAVLQVAVNVVTRDKFANDASTLKGHIAQQACLIRSQGALDDVDIATVAIDDLPAVAPGCPKPHLHSLQHGDPKPLFGQVQCRRDTGEAGANHTDVGFAAALQRRSSWRGVG